MVVVLGSWLWLIANVTAAFLSLDADITQDTMNSKKFLRDMCVTGVRVDLCL